MNSVASHHYQLCKCDHCPGQVQFTRPQLGQTVECPHCGLETVLREPRRSVATFRPASKIPLLVTGISLAIFVLLAVADAAWWGTGIFAMLLISVGALLVYFMPAYIACTRRHRNAAGVVILNLAFGWTLIGWIAALIWAVHQEKQTAP